jgi:MFS family permease
VSLSQNLGALAERNFRLLFTSSTVSACGDGISKIALVFAVLQVSHSPVALGLVLAGRLVANAAIALAAGVWSDRLPRHLVLIGVATVCGAAQAASGLLLLGGRATVGLLLVLQVVYGLGEGFVYPATMGLVPATISEGRLQEANALLGLSQNVVGVLGPALGGVAVALGSPGAALLVDAASFAVAGLLLLRLRLPRQVARSDRLPFLEELRTGWGEFRRQTWLWTTIVFFGIANFAAMAYSVLGPVIAKQDLGGAAAWATLVSAGGLGAVAGGIVVLRIRPSRPLVVSVVTAAGLVLQPLAIAFAPPVAVLAPISFLSGLGLGVHIALWFTVFQEQVPEGLRSRVSSYDVLFSYIFVPLGAAIAGPVADAIGVREALLASAAIEALCLAVILAQPSVWAIRAGHGSKSAVGTTAEPTTLEP